MSYLTDIDMGLRQPGGIAASSSQMHGEAGAGVVREAVGLGFSVMELCNETHYVKPEPEVRAIVVQVPAARLPQRLKQPVTDGR
jgi:hypothetical protein